MSDIRSTNCEPLIDAYCVNSPPETPSTGSETSSDEDYFNDPTPPAKYELYIPAPSHLNREGAFRYHLTTRNFFAWMYEKPVVGDRLGEALISLLERMNTFRVDEDENLDDMLAYIDGQEYTDFRSCPDHALAVLQFAEKFELLDLWRDSFCHCAGMNDKLPSSAEFEFVSRQSKALIVRAQLEMELRLENAGRSLGNFLEDDLSGAYLGLGKHAQMHMDRFRSFILSFYVAKNGYWPPERATPTSTSLPKSTYRSMYFEFRNLYEYLVDNNSSNRTADGGICVLQNIKAFDKRNKYISLPQTLPLVPEIPSNLHLRAHRSKSVRKLFSHSATKAERRAITLAALSAATNPNDYKVMDCGLVREYLRFEKSWTAKEEDRSVSSSDARKVRWILIYAILQTLISVTRAPPEVRDTEDVPYPLCCQVAGTPPWEFGEKQKRRTKNSGRLGKVEEKVNEEDRRRVAFTTNAIEIQPDEADLFAPKPAPLSYTPKTTTMAPAAAAATAQPRPPPSLPRKVSITKDLALRSPQPQKPNLVDTFVRNYSRESVSGNSSPQGSSSPGGDSTTSSKGRSSPVSPLRSESAWSAKSGESGGDGMEHASVCGSESCYGDESGVELGGKDGGRAKMEREREREMMKSWPPVRWDSVRSAMTAGEMGKVNPEVDMYIWG
ncbi:MAG: hypothetical protein LQ342_002609 [Letrouitia transgressa]|nr:MAG: hypothetical protein LQ342_002609 [Letrouitia transgressa]